MICPLWVGSAEGSAVHGVHGVAVQGSARREREGRWEAGGWATMEEGRLDFASNMAVANRVELAGIPVELVGIRAGLRVELVGIRAGLRAKVLSVPVDLKPGVQFQRISPSCLLPWASAWTRWPV